MARVLYVFPLSLSLPHPNPNPNPSLNPYRQLLSSLQEKTRIEATLTGQLELQTRDKSQALKEIGRERRQIEVDRSVLNPNCTIKTITLTLTLSQTDNARTHGAMPSTGSSTYTTRGF